MYEGHSVGVVVPAYNEEGYVGRTIDTIPDYVDRIYVVDDASTDGTRREIAEHAAAANETRTPDAEGFEVTVVTLCHEENRGVGGAIKTGYRQALADGVEVTAVMGGDNQMDPEELHRYLDPIVRGEADYVKGSRFLRPEDWEEMPRFRLAGNVALSYLTKVASGYWRILDPQNGYTAISRSALQRVPFEEMYEYYGYCNDLLVKANVCNLRVADVPRSSAFAYEDGWKSHIDYREYVPRVSGMLLRNFFYRINRKYLLYDFHPLALFYYLGMAIAGVGLARLGAALLDGDEARRDDGVVRTVLAGVLLFLFAATLDARDNRPLERRVMEPDAASDAVERDGDEPVVTGSPADDASHEVIDTAVAADGGDES